MTLQANIQLPEDNIKLQANNTRAFIGETECGVGTLCVAESNLLWKKQNDNNGLCLSYPNIAIQAISTDLTAFPHECLYLILDKNALSDDNESSSDNEDDSENVPVVRFVPEDKSLLNPLFQAMNDCQALYPDNSMLSDEDQEEGEEDEENGEEFEDEDGAVNMDNFEPVDPDNIQLSARGQQILRRLNINYENMNPENGSSEEKNGDHFESEQFEDAENN